MRYFWGIVSCIPFCVFFTVVVYALATSPDIKVSTIRTVSIAIGVVVGLVICTMFAFCLFMAAKGIKMFGQRGR